MGDFRQIAPIINNGDRQEIVNASIKMSLLWSHFKIMHLTINMRLLQSDQNNTEQKQYADLILAIGEGYHLNPHADMQSWDKNIGQQSYVLSKIPYLLSEDDSVNFIHPNRIITPETVIDRAILAISNKDVDHWNTKIQELNPNEAITLTSKDNLCEVDDPHGILKQMLKEDILNQFNHNSCPLHNLILKIGDICIITRNIAKKQGLTNNARVIITNIQQYCITVNFNFLFFTILNMLLQVQTIGILSKSFQIPRIRFKFRLPFGESFQMSRLQFPLRLGYCITVNKSQGQEYNHLLIDLRNPSFAHGHLYVALSRVKYFNKIAILVNTCDTRDDIYPIVKNIIYPELLLKV